MLFQWREALTGAAVGALVGALAGFGLGFWSLLSPGLFPGDTVVLFALVGGTLGLLLGQQFTDWARDWWFWLF